VLLRVAIRGQESRLGLGLFQLLFEAGDLLYALCNEGLLLTKGLVLVLDGFAHMHNAGFLRLVDLLVNVFCLETKHSDDFVALRRARRQLPLQLGQLPQVISLLLC
jgi:hypothetical protein